MEFLEILKAILFGIVEGITEWLPVSSTGHIILLKNVLNPGISSDAFWDMFEVVIQLGAILAVILLFFRKLKVNRLGHIVSIGAEDENYGWAITSV